MASLKKISRRQNKYKNIVNKEFGLKCDNACSRCLMLCNAGLVCNTSREDVLQVFGHYGKVEYLVMPPAKSYCFLKFELIEDAITCYDQLNGKSVFPKMDSPLYLLFVDNIPSLPETGHFGELPPGLFLIPDFVSESEERLLLDCVHFDHSDADIGELKNRLVKHYGYEFLYGRNDVDKDSPLEQKIPVECYLVFDKLKLRGLSEQVPWVPDQFTVNRYDPGQGIPSHIDTHSTFLDPILSLSLGSPIVMDFKRGSDTVSVDLPRRSLLIMSGESRYAWSHCICPRKSDEVPHPDGGLTTRSRGIRTSFTFRKIRHLPCDCQYRMYCDSQKDDIDIPEHLAPSVESTYVHQVYNKISDHFSCTRHKPWPKVLEFIKSFPSGSVLVDVGCGNGKYFGLCNNMVELGVDQCPKLIEICKERKFEGLVGSCLSLPIKSNLADCVICIAVIHHLSTQSRRVQAIREMARITRVGGKILIYAWAKDQKANNTASSYLKQSRKNRKKNANVDDTSPDGTKLNMQLEDMELEVDSSEGSKIRLPLHENRTSFQHHDLLVPWKLKQSQDSTPSETFLRFYHVFNDNELQNLCSTIDSVKIEENYYDQGNWCIILEKIKTNHSVDS